MKTWKTYLALLCTLAMVFAMLAGCGTPASSSASGAESAAPAAVGSRNSRARSHRAAPSAAASSAEPPDSVLEEPKQELTEGQQALLDLIPEGDMLTIFLELPSLAEEKTEMTCFAAVHSMLLTMYENLSDMPFYSALEDATGVHMTFTAISSMGDDDGTALSLMIAADDLTDIGCFGSGLTQGIDNAIEDGTIINRADHSDCMPNDSALD